MRVNLGCGKRRMLGWVNVDSQASVNPDICRKLEDGLPFAANSVEVFNARAIIEHVPQDRLTFVMREIYRCLKPGGLFYVMVPHWNQKWMWSDPTHYTGWSREMMDWFVGKNKPSDIGVDFQFEDVHYEPLYFPGAQVIAHRMGLTLDEAEHYLTNIIDAHIWWLKKPGNEVNLGWREVAKEIEGLGIYPNGYSQSTGSLGVDLDSSKLTGAEAPELRNAPKMRERAKRVRRGKLLSEWKEGQQKNRLLWFINVAWIGGTAYWALEAIKAMPLWDHVVCFLNGNENPVVVDKFADLGVDFSKAGSGVTKELVHSINPAAIILSNTSPNKIEGENPWSWLTSEYPVFYVHHSAVTPWLPKAEADIFVSQYLKSQYGNLLSRMKRAMVVHSGVDIQPFLRLPVKVNQGVVVGSLASDSPLKFPQSKLDIFKKIVGERVIGQIVGGQKYYEVAQAGDVQLFDFTDDPVKFFKKWDIFVNHCNVDDTWGRVVAEAMASGIPVVSDKRGAIPELVEDGVSGFLCDSPQEIVKKVEQLIREDGLRETMGKRGREKIKAICGVNPFKREVEPLIVEKVLRG